MSKKTNYITEILLHDVSWYVESNSIRELDESSIEHIEKCIQDGISAGELCISYGKSGTKTSYGWWHIINWRDIAATLNAYGKFDTPQAKKAQERFNE